MMLEFVPSCLRRHKKKLFFLGGVVGGVVIFNTYLKRKFIEWETQRTSDMCDQLKKSSHFENTMLTCDSVFMSISRKIREIVFKEIEVDVVVGELKQNPPNKVQLWEELKVLVFTQVIGDMYAHCLSCILLRVQMSVLSGYNFVRRGTSASVTPAQQQKYMAHFEDFIVNGISRLLIQVKKACETKLQTYSLSEPLLLKDIEKIIASIQEDINTSNSQVLPDISPLLTIPGTSKSAADNFLSEITTETKDVLECEDFKKVLSMCVNCGVSLIMDHISECYAFLNSEKKFTNLNELSAPLAKLIPIIHNRYSQQDPSDDQALAHKLIQIEKLNIFAANIYEAFSQKKS